MFFKFLTLNICHGGRPIKKMINFLKEEKPDVLVLQEVYDGKERFLVENFHSFDILKRESGFKYGSFSPLFSMIIKKQKVPQGNAIFSKFPIISSSLTYFDHQYGEFDFENWFELKDYSFVPSGLQHCKIEVDKTIFNVFNIHGIWGVDGKDNEERFKMGEIILKKIKNKQNVILAGDFNLNPDTQTVNSIERELKNVFKNKLKTTFNLKRKKVPGDWKNAVVDMIFVSKNVKVLEYHCPQADISDHLPLVCIFEI